MSEVEPTGMRNLPVRRCSIENIEHPEWGAFGIMEDRGEYYEIHGRGGGRVLHKDEAVRFWRVAGYMSRFAWEDREIRQELTPEQRRWIAAVLANDEISTDESLVEYFRENGLTEARAREAVAQRSYYLGPNLPPELYEDPK